MSPHPGHSNLPSLLHLSKAHPLFKTSLKDPLICPPGQLWKDLKIIIIINNNYNITIHSTCFCLGLCLMQGQVYSWCIHAELHALAPPYRMWTRHLQQAFLLSPRSQSVPHSVQGGTGQGWMSPTMGRGPGFLLLVPGTSYVTLTNSLELNL